jgi:hypothetical protein
MVLDTKAEPMEQAAIAAAISELQTPKTKKSKEKKNPPQDYWKKKFSEKNNSRGMFGRPKWVNLCTQRCKSVQNSSCNSQRETQKTIVRRSSS